MTSNGADTERSGPDTGALVSLARGLCASDSLTTVQDTVLAFSQRRFAASASCFFVMSDRAPRFDFTRFYSHDLDGRTMPLYQDYYHEIDPIAQRLIELPLSDGPGAYVADRLLSYKTFQESEFYRDFMQPRAVHHVMSMRLAVGRRLAGLVSLYRSPQEPRFSDSDASQASAFAPLVSLALDRALHAELEAEQSEIVDGLLSDRGRNGVALLDEQLRVLYSDGLVARVIAGVEGLGCEIGRRSSQELPAALRDKCRRMALATGRSPELRRPDDLLALADGQLVALRLNPVQAFQRSKRYVLVFERVEPDSDSRTAAQNAGLSKRETQIVALILRGCSPVRIADALCISPYTVNNHLRAIYSKLAVRSRSELILRLKQFPGSAA